MHNLPSCEKSQFLTTVPGVYRQESCIVTRVTVPQKFNKCVRKMADSPTEPGLGMVDYI